MSEFETRSISTLEAVVNHVVLPIRTPDRLEDLSLVHEELVNRSIATTKTIRDTGKAEEYQQWDILRRLLVTCKELNMSEGLNKATIMKSLENIEHGSLVILYVKEQNAGIIVRRDGKKSVVFECFEASARATDILASSGAMQWTFLQNAVAVPYSTFAEAGFLDSVATFLQQASRESIKRFAAHATKAGASTFEERDTVNPTIITDLFMTILEANGQRVYPSVIRKQVRDDVCWSIGAVEPWKRSPFWLILRVSLIRFFTTTYGDHCGLVHYKFFICIFLSQLLSDTIENIEIGLLQNLKSKLARRLSKLEAGMATSNSALSCYQAYFTIFSVKFRDSLAKATVSVKSAWESFKRKTQKRIPPLPYRVDDVDMRLSLTASGKYLDDILSNAQFEDSSQPFKTETEDISRKPGDAFAATYFSITAMELEFEDGTFVNSLKELADEKACVEIYQKIRIYLESAIDAYRESPEMMSYLILTAVELWILLEQRASRIHGLLKLYVPLLRPEYFNILLLPRRGDMERLQEIQRYLGDRLTETVDAKMTILDQPQEGCLAERFYDESESTSQIKRIQARIEVDVSNLMIQKSSELERKSKEYSNLQNQANILSCEYTMTDDGYTHVRKSCTKCFLFRKLRRIKILIFEDPLPEKKVEAKAVLFELCMPVAIDAYRDATWLIMCSVALPETVQSLRPKFKLRDFKPLQAYYNNSRSGRVRLASTAKPFLDTHFREIGLPVELPQVCRPNGLKVCYFDEVANIKTGMHSLKFSFARFCRFRIPPSPFEALQYIIDKADDYGLPTSNEIIANQSRCPAGLNLNEFTTFQNLLIAETWRWPLILLELGSCNLNFSNEATSALIGYLSSHVGMASADEPMRLIHWAFTDDDFCQQLLNQISQRLQAIVTNWREIFTMDMLISLILRLISLSGSKVSQKAYQLLGQARIVTLGWILQLRPEIHEATDSDRSKQYMTYALWSALCCKRTFAIYAENDIAEAMGLLDTSSLEIFIQASLLLQENLDDDPKSLTLSLKIALARDLQLTYRIRNHFRQSLAKDSATFIKAFKSLWPRGYHEDASKYVEIKFLPPPEEWILEVSTPQDEQFSRQTIHYNCLRGTFTVDGKPLGRLPSIYKKSTIVETLFGKQALLTHPSSVPGMTYALLTCSNYHHIHIGTRKGEIIVRAFYKHDVLEVIPSKIFYNDFGFDLPESLVSGCVHWLDVKTGILEIRKQNNPWKHRRGNWKVNVYNRCAWRNENTLVDPQSSLFRKITDIFHLFELPKNIEVFQTKKANLVVSLPRFELSFQVTPNNLLYSRQLQAVIDPNQDVGAWYGLESKLVLRGPIGSHRRRVIVPTGEISYRKDGIHMAIQLENDGIFGIYTVNEILGRLECPTEARLIYLKAQLHAYTSFFLPDPLTGRTGTEEALHYLRSGHCLPWMPLRPYIAARLGSLLRLTPRRLYYPEGSRFMQSVYWDSQLTTHIQHEAFWPTVTEIYKRSERLSLFSPENKMLERPGVCTDETLQARAMTRQSMSERFSANLCDKTILKAKIYRPRDEYSPTITSRNVYQCAALVKNWTDKLRMTSDLQDILDQMKMMEGYVAKYSKVLISEHLDIDLLREMGPLVAMCRESDRSQMYQLMFLLSTTSFRDDARMDIIRILVAYATCESLRELKPPEWDVYICIGQSAKPTVDYLAKLMRSYWEPLEAPDYGGFALNAKDRKKFAAADREHSEQCEAECKSVACFLLNQWPCTEPTLDEYVSKSSLAWDPDNALVAIQPEWLRIFKNLELRQYVEDVQQILDALGTSTEPKLPDFESSKRDVIGKRFGRVPWPVHCGELLQLEHQYAQDYGCKPSHELLATAPIPRPCSVSRSTPEKFLRATAKAQGLAIGQEVMKLDKLLFHFTTSTSSVRRNYGEAIMRSLQALNAQEKSEDRVNYLPELRHLPGLISAQSHEVTSRLARFRASFEHENPYAKWLSLGGLWPSVTPILLLEKLRAVAKTMFGRGMKEALVAYGTSITYLQRLIRISEAARSQNLRLLREDLRNQGHQNWEPMEQLDWLLLEIENNMLIRPTQIKVARSTISPKSGVNSVLQMNMGQGKTSTVMPMVAAVLGNGERLVRLIVPKPLLGQTAQLIQQRIGGLLGRHVLYVPFSRKTSTSPLLIKNYWDLHKDSMESAGILIALHENILSFRLSGDQCLSDKRLNDAVTMLNTQAWLDEHSRDVLDECDVTLAVRTQLIYPTGQQTTVDGHPHRWEVAEAVLQMVQDEARMVQLSIPKGIEVVDRPGRGFPLIFLLNKEAADILVCKLVASIIRGGNGRLPIEGASSTEREAIKEFITNSKVPPGVTERISNITSIKPWFSKILLLLRGLIAHRILLFALRKRWNVQYGLDRRRDPISVPYHAKGLPSELGEWGHPDVAILFTCLSHYLNGLDNNSLRQAFEIIAKSDDPWSEYDRWTQSVHNLPDSLKDWNSINAEDETQLLEVWRHLRYSTVVIDFYLNNLVFPRHSKQFHTKLVASAWDIPLTPRSYESTNRNKELREALTSGFSGTNDNRDLLPLNIKQDDLPGLEHTNAEVITYLLQDRNRGYVRVADSEGRRVSEEGMLHMFKRMDIRMLIDAGALILEMSNYDLVSTWLRVDTEAKAGLYFDSEDKAYVLYRNFNSVPLLASPFANDLSGCLVYLDEAHIRGTDLKMPVNARGALTLGMGQTKDHTVQAAMRLRQLATTQSVVFFAPPEVHQSILDLTSKSYIDSIDSADVLLWLFEQTCSGIDQLQPLYYSQGIEFCHHRQAAIDNPAILTDVGQRRAYLAEIRRPENHTLEQLYHPVKLTSTSRKCVKFSKDLSRMMEVLQRKKKEFQDTGLVVAAFALQEVEQEREVAHEIETVREVEKPIHYKPLRFGGLHKDLQLIAMEGLVPSNITGYEHYMVTMGKSAVGIKHNLTTTTVQSRLYVSCEFNRTISKVRPNDNFMRQVNWVLWNQKSETAIVICLEEVERLLCLVRDYGIKSRTHLLAYAAPITRKMLHFNDLTYYAVPKLSRNWTAPLWLRIELGFFAGRIYFPFDEYEAIKRFHIGSDPATSASREQQRPGNIDDTSPESQTFSSLAAKPLLFLQEWLTLRRHSQDCSQTPMGFVYQRRHMAVQHPFFRENQVAVKPIDASSLTYRRPELTSERSPDHSDEEDDFFDDNLDEDFNDKLNEAEETV